MRSRERSSGSTVLRPLPTDTRAPSPCPLSGGSASLRRGLIVCTRSAYGISPRTVDRFAAHQGALAPQPPVDIRQRDHLRSATLGHGGPRTEHSRRRDRRCRVVDVGPPTASWLHRLRLGHARVAPLADQHPARVARDDVGRRMPRRALGPRVTAARVPERPSRASVLRFVRA